MYNILCSLIFFASLESTAFAKLSAEKIMMKVGSEAVLDSSTVELSMILIDKNGNKRERQLKTYQQVFGDANYTLSFFESPREVKGTSFLTIVNTKNPEKGESWLYLPAIKKVKKIAQASSSESFMGSDFTYADMKAKNYKNYNHKLLKETKDDTAEYWVIESTPKTSLEEAESGYSKSVQYVRKDNYFITKSAHWLTKSKKIKMLRVEKLQNIDGKLFPTYSSMQTRLGKKLLHQTVIYVSKIDTKKKLEKEFFSHMSMKKGI